MTPSPQIFRGSALWAVSLNETKIYVTAYCIKDMQNAARTN